MGFHLLRKKAIEIIVAIYRNPYFFGKIISKREAEEILKCYNKVIYLLGLMHLMAFLERFNKNGFRTPTEFEYFLLWSGIFYFLFAFLITILKSRVASVLTSFCNPFLITNYFFIVEGKYFPILLYISMFYGFAAYRIFIASLAYHKYINHKED